MFVTVEILQKRGACQEAIDFFQKHYPNGAEMLDLIQKGHFIEHFLHWGREFLDPNKEELAAYFARLKVTNSEGVFESARVSDSICVNKSTDISGSEYIDNSKNITSSVVVHSSKYVTDSENVWDSFVVEQSHNVLDSKNVIHSKEVVQSNYIVQSDGIYDSNNIVNGSVIWRSDNLTNCGFCANCHNLKNGLFCIGAEDGEYLLFNKPIDQVRFEMIYRMYQQTFAPQIALLSGGTYNSNPSIIYDYRKHIEGISEDFWEWVETLPGYDSRIIYSLTFIPRFLK